MSAKPIVINCQQCGRPLHVATPAQPIECVCGAHVEPDKLQRAARRRRIAFLVLGVSLCACCVTAGLVAYLAGWFPREFDRMILGDLPPQQAIKPADKDRWPAGGVLLAAGDPVTIGKRTAAERDIVEMLKPRRANAKNGPIFLDHPSTPYAVAFAGDVPLVAVAGGTETRLWDLKTGQVTRTLPGVVDFFNALAVSPDGNLLAASDRRKGTVTVWSTAQENEKPVHTLDLGREAWSLHFSTDGSRLIALLKYPAGNGAVNNALPDTARSWEVKTWQERVLPIDAGEGGGPVRPDARYRIVEGPYRAYDLQEGTETEIPVSLGSHACALSHSGRHFMLAHVPRPDVSELFVCDLATGKRTLLGTIDGMGVTMQYLPDDAHVFGLVNFNFDAKTGKNRAEHRLIDAANGKQIWSSPSNGGLSAVSPGGKLIAIGRMEGL